MTILPLVTGGPETRDAPAPSKVGSEAPRASRSLVRVSHAIDNAAPGLAPFIRNTEA